MVSLKIDVFLFHIQQEEQRDQDRWDCMTIEDPIRQSDRTVEPLH